MDNNVIAFTKPEPSGYDGLTCSCGSAWFVLEGVACVGADRAITGYSGEITCWECSAPLTYPASKTT